MRVGIASALARLMQGSKSRGLALVVVVEVGNVMEEIEQPVQACMVRWERLEVAVEVREGSRRTRHQAECERVGD